MERNGIDGALPGSEERRELAVRRPLDLAGFGGLADEEATETAKEAVRRARSEAPERENESPAPSPEEVRRAFGL